jgi:hypothetical protein
MAARSSGGDGAVLVEEGAAEGVRAPGLHGSTCGAPAKPVGGSEGPEGRRRRAIVMAKRSHLRVGQMPFRRGESLGSSVEYSDGFLVPRRSRYGGLQWLRGGGRVRCREGRGCV